MNILLLTSHDKLPTPRKRFWRANFTALPKQTAHRAKFGETGCKSGCSQRKPEVLFVKIKDKTNAANTEDSLNKRCACSSKTA